MPSTASPEQQLGALLERFDPSIRRLVADARDALRRRWPTATELVYANAAATVVGFSSSERKSDVIVSLAAYARGVNLYFMYGAALADPHHLLLGAGSQGRFLRLESTEVLDRPEVVDLLNAAVAEGDTPLPRKGGGQLVVKSVSARARTRPRAPRRP